mgnify:CR=1 FL=1
MKLLNGLAAQIIRDYIGATKTKVSVVAGSCRMNYECHSNAVHDAIEQKMGVAMLVGIYDSGSPFIHFVNVNRGKYIDNTLGAWSSRYDFYFIRIIDKQELWEVHKIFDAYRKELRRMMPWYVRLLSDFKA